MPQTRRSLGIPSNEEFAARKRRNSSPFKKLYPNLTEGVSYASTATTFVKTSEVQDEDDDGLETEHDSSFASSVGSERPSPDNENEPWKLVLVGILIFLLAVCIGLMVRATTSNGQVF
uniref:Uncharacterized protein n=1 Tax=Caenorhabditis japonica TaxID=281687 RepID=A0A8R1EKB0_CAEJA